MTGISMPEALVACVAMICIAVFVTSVTLKGMDVGFKNKDREKNKE
jgi:hypothetical protein